MSILVIAIVSLILVVVILVVSLLIYRSSVKKKAKAIGASGWQRHGQPNTPFGWNQQGSRWGPNSWNQPNSWRALQQPSGWEQQMPAQQQAAGRGAQNPAQQQTPWDAQNPAQQQPAAGWGPQNQTPQQPVVGSTSGAANTGGQQQWNIPSSSPDASVQPQQEASPSGQQSNQSAAPPAYKNVEDSGQSSSQPAQVADQWDQPGPRAAYMPLPPPMNISPPRGNIPLQQQGPGQARQGFDVKPVDSSEADRSILRRAGGSQGSGQVPLRNLAREYLQFTSFHRRVVPTATWGTLLVYAYIESAVEAIRADVAKFKDELGPVPGEENVWASRPISRDTQITIIPTCQGITFNPPSFSFIWIEDWYRATFRFQADNKLAGSICNGEIVIYAGPLIIATLKISLRFLEQNSSPTTANISNIAEVSAYLYKKIFASYSHSDTSIVLACRNTYQALGLDYLIDIDKIRSGQRWNTALLKMIDTADIFQLFWSANSARSPNVRQEWQYALQHSKDEGFIRPVYWQRPLIPPPGELSHMHFAYIELPRLENANENREVELGNVRIEKGKDAGRVYEVRKESLRIGRKRENDIFLEDMAVSRLHASIINLGNNNYALRDEGSANGTKVNGQPVNKYQPYPLHEGDKIQIGQTVLVFSKR